MKKLILSEFIILLVGVLFSWTNFAIELYSWWNKRACLTGCAAPGTNPFLTPCFYGAIFFLIAFIVSAVIYKKSLQNAQI